MYYKSTSRAYHRPIWWFCLKESDYAPRRLKTFLRTCSGADRLNGLRGTLSIHRNIAGNIDPLDVIDRLARNPRRLDTVI